MIQIILLDETLPGMVLGTVINTAHINSLRRCGVNEIVMLAPSDLMVAKINERREALRGQVERLFRRASSNVTIQALWRAVLEYRLEKLK